MSIPASHNKQNDITLNDQQIIKKLEDNNKDELLNQQLERKYENNTIDFKYICIKKEHFDVGMIYLKYTNLKKENYIEIIYKSPSIHLDGLFFKTPALKVSQLLILIRDKGHFTNAHIQCILNKNNDDNGDFINMMKSIDTYISLYIGRHARDINSKMHSSLNMKTEDNNEYHYLNYENIIKPHYSKQQSNLSYSSVASGINGINGINGLNDVTISNSFKNRFASGGSIVSRLEKKWNGDYEIIFKSYIDRKLLENIRQELVTSNKKYIITFNISNLYFGKTGIVPLIKCNRCEEV